jgi:hypothetical protein
MTACRSGCLHSELGKASWALSVGTTMSLFCSGVTARRSSGIWTGQHYCFRLSSSASCMSTQVLKDADRHKVQLIWQKSARSKPVASPFTSDTAARCLCHVVLSTSHQLR